MLTSLLLTKENTSFFYRWLVIVAVLSSVLLLSSYSTAAISSGLGTFTLDGGAEVRATSATGTYETNLASGRFTIECKAINGYDAKGPTFKGGSNGIEVLLPQDFGSSNDTFTCTLKLITSNPNYINTIKIAQASYTSSSGNSEVARQTISYEKDTATGVAARAYVALNDPVPMFYNAMGDYFMGVMSTTPNRYTTSSLLQPQLRVDSSSVPIYYYKLDYLLGTSSNGNYDITTSSTDNSVNFKANNSNGWLPPSPNRTITNIFKSSSTEPNNKDTYAALAKNAVISNGGSYVSYGVANSDSKYVVDVYNASSVTLTYKGIMLGSSAAGNISATEPRVGETFNEWITFGVSSETAPNYTFTGFVFNDNGGIASNNNPETKFDISSTFTNNKQYFNGIFEPTKESGIGSDGLQVRLTNCGLDGGTNIAGTATQSIPSLASSDPMLGKYIFTVPASVIATLSPQKVCVVQIEPNDWKYSVDTTPNIREINLATDPNKLDYKTDSTINLDFGEVETNHASLVLIKYQYVNNCDINENYDTPSQTPTFSIGEIPSIAPGKCIAYRIDAYNRGHVDLKDVQISDRLQTKAQSGSVDSIFVMPLPKAIPPVFYNSATLPSSTIISNKFDLNKPAGISPTKGTLYFNTKYRTTANP